MKKIIFLLPAIAFACRQQPQSTSAELRKHYKDSVFLEIPDVDLHDPEQWINVDRRVYLRAYKRLERTNFIRKDTLAWHAQCGADIKISENIYDYITDTWMSLNHKLDGDYELRRDTSTNTYNIVHKNAPEKNGLIKIKN